jgi:hypothetical protein
MLWFERRVVTTLVRDLDQQRRSAVVAHVDGVLRDMPEHLRAGVAAESLLLGAWARLRDPARYRDPEAGADLEPLDHSPIGLVRQYVRLLRSLVLFAEHELAPTAGAAYR